MVCFFLFLPVVVVFDGDLFRQFHTIVQSHTSGCLRVSYTFWQYPSCASIPSLTHSLSVFKYVRDCEVHHRKIFLQCTHSGHHTCMHTYTQACMYHTISYTYELTLPTIHVCMCVCACVCMCVSGLWREQYYQDEQSERDNNTLTYMHTRIHTELVLTICTSKSIKSVRSPGVIRGVYGDTGAYLVTVCCWSLHGIFLLSPVNLRCSFLKIMRL